MRPICVPATTMATASMHVKAASGAGLKHAEGGLENAIWSERGDLNPHATITLSRPYKSQGIRSDPGKRRPPRKGKQEGQDKPPARAGRRLPPRLLEPGGGLGPPWGFPVGLQSRCRRRWANLAVRRAPARLCSHLARGVNHGSAMDLHSVIASGILAVSGRGKWVVGRTSCAPMFDQSRLRHCGRISSDGIFADLLCVVQS